MSYRELLRSGDFLAAETVVANVKYCENGFRDIDIEEGNFFLLKDKTRALTLQYKVKYQN